MFRGRIQGRDGRSRAVWTPICIPGRSWAVFCGSLSDWSVRTPCLRLPRWPRRFVRAHVVVVPRMLLLRICRGIVLQNIRAWMMSLRMCWAVPMGCFRKWIDSRRSWREWRLSRVESNGMHETRCWNRRICCRENVARSVVRGADTCHETRCWDCRGCRIPRVRRPLNWKYGWLLRAKAMASRNCRLLYSRWLQEGQCICVCRGACGSSPLPGHSGICIWSRYCRRGIRHSQCPRIVSILKTGLRHMWDALRRRGICGCRICPPWSGLRLSGRYI